MSNQEQLTDQQKIKELEKEVLSMKEIIKRIEDIIGITPDYVHEPIEPLNLE